jgi:hypothetical protein
MLWATLFMPLAASAAVLETRQSAGLLAGVDELKPQFRSTAKRTLTKMGRMLCLITIQDLIADFQ